MRLLPMLLIMSFFANAQDSSSFKTERNKMYFERVFYTSDSNISKTLTAFVPTIKAVKDFYKTESSITARFVDLEIDYQKYGCKWGNTSVIFNHPMTAAITIVWKDGKYKVTVSDMKFIVSATIKPLELNNAPKKDGSLPKNKAAVRSLDCFEKYLIDLFTISKNADNW